MTIIRKLAAERAAQGLSLEEVGRRARIHASTVCRMEQGCCVSVRTLFSVCAALGFTRVTIELGSPAAGAVVFTDDDGEIP